MRLPLEPCIGRWLLHVPPLHAVRGRCWGLYAQTQGHELAAGRQPLGQGPVETPAGVEGQRIGEEPAAAQAEERCPVCGPRLVGIALLPRAGAPPPGEPGWAPVA